MVTGFDWRSRISCLPALVSSASAYVAFALIQSTLPLLLVTGVSESTFSDILFCGLIGLARGFGARVFARVIEWAKDGRALPKSWLRILVEGTSPAVIAAMAAQLYGEPLTLGPRYRTPLAAASFVAEATGRPGAVVPGLIATAIAQLMMGEASVSPYIRQRRVATWSDASACL